jgi:dienelactone hydrolase
VDIFSDFVLPDDTLEDWQRRRERMQRRVLDYFGTGPDEPPTLEPELGPEEPGPGYVRRRVSYQVEPGARVPAYLFLPEGQTAPRPTVLCYHGTNPVGKEAVSGLRVNQNYAVELAQRGYVTLAPDQWASGERQGVDDQPLHSGNLYARHPEWSVEGKTAWDHMRAVDFLEQLPQADATRLGAIGLSRGGRATIYHMLMDERVKAGVPACGTPPYRSDPRLARLAAADRFVTVPKAVEEIRRGRLPGYDIHEAIALIAPRPLLLISPFVDQFAPHGRALSDLAEKVGELYRFLGAGNNFARFVHGEGHNTGPILRAAAYAWLDYHLKGEVPGLPGRNWGDEAPGVADAQASGPG